VLTWFGDDEGCGNSDEWTCDGWGGKITRNEVRDEVIVLTRCGDDEGCGNSDMGAAIRTNGPVMGGEVR
jgi:hypothetical protein